MQHFIISFSFDCKYSFKDKQMAMFFTKVSKQEKR